MNEDMCVCVYDDTKETIAAVLKTAEKHRKNIDNMCKQTRRNANKRRPGNRNLAKPLVSLAPLRVGLGPCVTFEKRRVDETKN